MKSFKQVEQMIDRARLRTDRATDERTLDDARAALAETMNHGPRVPRPGQTLWRTIMESKMTKYSAAAMVALAAALVLMNPLGISKHGVALAEVRERIAQVDTMVLRGQTTFTSVADPNKSVQFDNTKYMSRRYGFAEDGYIKGTLVYRIVLNRDKKQTFLQLAPWKKCLRFPCTEEQIQVIERLTPTGVVDMLLETPYKKLGVSQIDSVEAEGFEVQDLRPLENITPKFLLDIQQSTATIWVGTKELLPIHMEADMVIGKAFWNGFTEVRSHELAILDSYDVELDPKLFDTSIPEGYTEFRITDLLPGKLGMAGLGILPILPAGAVVWTRFSSKKTGRMNT